MKLLNWRICILLAVACLPPLGIAAAIDANSESTATLQWTRDCKLTAKDKSATKAVITCDDYSKEMEAARSIVAALNGQSLTVNCRAFRGRGVFAATYLDCGKPPAEQDT